MSHPAAPTKPTVDQVARPSRDALTSLEEMFRRSAAVAHDLLTYFSDPERHDDDHAA